MGARRGPVKRWARSLYASAVRWPRVAGTCLLGAALFLSGCEAPEPPLRVATIQWIGYQPLHLAQALGYFARHPVRLADFHSNTESLRAFRNRNVEVAALTLDEVLLLRADGHDARVILILDYSEGADAIVAHPDIRDLADLRGRRIGVESTAAGAYLLARALEFGGLTTADVRLVKLGIENQVQAYREGWVDAFATFEPLRTRLLNLGARELFNSTRVPGEIVDVLVVRGELIDSHAAQLERLLDSWFQAVAYAAGQPEAAAARLAPRVELSAEEYRQAVAGMRFPTLAENCRLLSGETPQLADTVARLHAVMVKEALIDYRIPAPTGIFDDTIVRRLDCASEPAHAVTTEMDG